jgi:lysozyme
MKIGFKGLNLIKEFEGFRAKAYKCPAGVWTIGYGHTRGVTPTMTITLVEAEKLLRQDVGWAETVVNEYVSVGLNQSQFDALVSFVFNVGSGHFKSSTLLKKLNKGEYKEVPIELKRWNKANGKVLPGLTRRRKAEGDLFGEMSNMQSASQKSAVISNDD